MKPSRLILAFLWLTIGYWIISFIVPLLLLFLPFAKSSGGISTFMADGVYKIQFQASPGQIVALLGGFSTDTGDKQVSFPGMPHSDSRFIRADSVGKPDFRVAYCSCICRSVNSTLAPVALPKV